MKAFLPGIFCILLSASSFSPVTARGIQVPLPDELADKSTLICNGLVESVTETGTEKNGINSWDTMTHFTAKIKVLHVCKGQAPAEIEIKYDTSGQLTDNGPINIQLATGARYRFFLKNGPVAPDYVSALDGQYDDGFAVVMLNSNEPDDSAYISKTEAVDIATHWLKEHHPELPKAVEESPRRSSNGIPQLPPNHVYPCTRLYPYVGMNDGWTISISEISAAGAVIGSHQITILGDRTVDPKNWSRDH